jgi:two-component system response regulator
MEYNIVDILLIDDNIDDAELVMRELKKYQPANQLVHLKDGEAALAFIKAEGEFKDRNPANTPKLILLDIHMPKLNGMEVLERLKSDPGTKSIPVVILTSSKEDPDIKKCYQLGANSYIVKPVNFTRFTEAIKSLGFYWMLLNQSA